MLEQFRLQRDCQDTRKIERLMSGALQYAELVLSVHSHKVQWLIYLDEAQGLFLFKKLLESYNITTDKDAQQRELVEKTAKRVGFKLPHS